MFLQRRPAPAGPQVRRHAAGKHQLSRNVLGVSGWALSDVLGGWAGRQAHVVAAPARCAARHRDPGFGRRIGAILVAGQPGDCVLRRQVPDEGQDYRRHAGESSARRRPRPAAAPGTGMASFCSRPVSPTASTVWPRAGGKPQQVLKLDESKSERADLWPQFLPDGKHFVFYQQTDLAETSGVYVGSHRPPGVSSPLHQPDQRRVFGGLAGFTENAATCCTSMSAI